MIITLICDVYQGEENNGTAITTKRLIDGLEKLGHEVRIVSTYVTDDKRFYTIPTRSIPLFNGYIAKNGVRLAKPKREVLVKAIEGSDLVHLMLPFSADKMAIGVAKELGVPVTSAFHCPPEAVTSHVFLKNCKLVNAWLYKHFRRKIYRYTDCIHCPSEHIKNMLDIYGYKGKKYVISNGVAHDFYKKDVKKPKELKDKICILTSGRYSKEKRQDILLKAIEYSKYKDKIQLILAGSGPREKYLKKLGANLPNEPIYQFMNKVELNNTINYCDLYVHTADIESEAISCLEAISCGLVPIISNSRRSATRYFALHNENLFEAGKPQSLAKKIDYLLDNPDIVQQYSIEYLEYGKRFEIDSCVAKMVEMFEDAIKIYKEKKQ